MLVGINGSVDVIWGVGLRWFWSSLLLFFVSPTLFGSYICRALRLAVVFHPRAKRALPWLIPVSGSFSSCRRRHCFGGAVGARAKKAPILPPGKKPLLRVPSPASPACFFVQYTSIWFLVCFLGLEFTRFHPFLVCDFRMYIIASPNLTLTLCKPAAKAKRANVHARCPYGCC